MYCKCVDLSHQISHREASEMANAPNGRISAVAHWWVSPSSWSAVFAHIFYAYQISTCNVLVQCHVCDGSVLRQLDWIIAHWDPWGGSGIFPWREFFKDFNVWRFFGMINLFPDVLDPTNRFLGWFCVDIACATFFLKVIHEKVGSFWKNRTKSRFFSKIGLCILHGHVHFFVQYQGFRHL